LKKEKDTLPTLDLAVSRLQPTVGDDELIYVACEPTAGSSPFNRETVTLLMMYKLNVSRLMYFCHETTNTHVDVGLSYNKISHTYVAYFVGARRLRIYLETGFSGIWSNVRFI